MAAQTAKNRSKSKSGYQIRSEIDGGEKDKREKDRSKSAAAKKTLVIVESPSKAKTIGKYLGSSYKVIVVGHVRDLPKSKLGIDVEHDFEPQYIPIRGKGDLIKEPKKEAKAAGKVYLATDPDREGEAISWHLASLGTGPGSALPHRVQRNYKGWDSASKSPRHRYRTGGRTAGETRAGQTGRLSDQPASVAQDSQRLERRARAVRGAQDHL